MQVIPQRINAPGISPAVLGIITDPTKQQRPQTKKNQDTVQAPGQKGKSDKVKAGDDGYWQRYWQRVNEEQNRVRQEQQRDWAHREAHQQQQREESQRIQREERERKGQ